MRNEMKLDYFSAVCFLILLHGGETNYWWYLGISGTSYTTMLSDPNLNIHTACSHIDVFHPKQKKICKRSGNILDIVAEGAAVGIEECKFQFSDHRWNCTTYNTTDVFGNIIKTKGREKAYIYAISSAGVMHSIAKACSKGQLSGCGCDSTIRRRSTNGKFVWGGCSINTRFSSRLTREFLDSKESRKRDEGSMNIWNNEAGRKTIKKSMRQRCKCHGVSGSCSARICWRDMAPFRHIGRLLKERFDGASLVKYDAERRKFQPVIEFSKYPTKRDLIYMERSPNFCDADKNTGSIGTTGRVCDKDSMGLDGCSLLCCGRGFNKFEKVVTEDCDCKFVWCCDVKCSRCSKTILEYTCK